MLIDRLRSLFEKPSTPPPLVLYADFGAGLLPLASAYSPRELSDAVRDRLAWYTARGFRVVERPGAPGLWIERLLPQSDCYSVGRLFAVYVKAPLTDADLSADLVWNDADAPPVRGWN